MTDNQNSGGREPRTFRSISYSIKDFFAKIAETISRPVTAIVLGLCFGIAFWAIPFFIVANYQLLPVTIMMALMGLVVFFSVWGTVISVFFFILGFIFGVLLLYSTSPSASY